MGVMGNCASMEVLRQAGVESANLLIAVTGSDEVNLLTCTPAHYINPKLHTIARIRNPDYAEQAYSMRDAFALSMIVNPERQAATEIERLLRYPGFLKRDTFAKGRMEIVELKLEADSRLCNVTLSSLNTLVRCRVLVCAVLRGGNAIAPDGNFVLHAGDRVFVTASTEVLSELLKNLGIVTHRAERVMLIGGGKISYYLAQALEESRLDVQLVEKDPDICEQMAKALPRTTVIQGDAADRSVLEGEGLASCDALVTLTGLDELNMVISLYGSGFGVKQIITKVGRMEDGRVLDSLPLGSVICPRKLCPRHAEAGGGGDYGSHHCGRAGGGDRIPGGRAYPALRRAAEEAEAAGKHPACGNQPRRSYRDPERRFQLRTGGQRGGRVLGRNGTDAAERYLCLRGSDRELQNDRAHLRALSGGGGGLSPARAPAVAV